MEGKIVFTEKQDMWLIQEAICQRPFSKKGRGWHSIANRMKCLFDFPVNLKAAHVRHRIIKLLDDYTEGSSSILSPEATTQSNEYLKKLVVMRNEAKKVPSDQEPSTSGRDNTVGTSQPTNDPTPTVMDTQPTIGESGPNKRPLDVNELSNLRQFLEGKETKRMKLREEELVLRREELAVRREELAVRTKELAERDLLIKKFDDRFAAEKDIREKLFTLWGEKAQ